MIVRLDDKLWFPDPHYGEDDGLVAVGGDLSVDRLLLAYSYGFFPWFSFRNREAPLWYCPLQRFVIFPQEIHISHSMRQLINKNQYGLTINKDFDGVIRGCATAQNRNTEDGAWLGPDIIKAYTELHHQGFASSVEVWEKQADGIRLVALIFLARLFGSRGGLMIDCQFETPHLRSMGGRYISYDEYIALIRK